MRIRTSWERISPSKRAGRFARPTSSVMSTLQVFSHDASFHKQTDRLNAPAFKHFCDNRENMPQLLASIATSCQSYRHNHDDRSHVRNQGCLAFVQNTRNCFFRKLASQCWQTGQVRQVVRAGPFQFLVCGYGKYIEIASKTF